jgi:putative heme-binding domain-containing protein
LRPWREAISLGAFLLLTIAPAALWSQEPHAADDAAKAKQSAPAPATAGDANAKGGRGGGRGGENPAAVAAQVVRLMADPAALARGQKVFEAQCVECHGPGGEGSRGPTLAQPSLPRASDNASLVRIIQTGIPGTEMPAQRLQPGELPLLAAYVRSLGLRPIETVAGDVQKGAELLKSKGACLTCHTLHGEGVAIGPDLTDVGRRRSVAFLRRSLVDPGADVPQSATPVNPEGQPTNFLFVRAKTKAGKDVAGVRINESTYTLLVRDLTGRIHSLVKSDLVELHKDKGTSPMPVYTAVFTPAEMNDLLAYLVSLRGETSR